MRTLLLLALLLTASCRRNQSIEAALHDLHASSAERREAAAWDLDRLVKRHPDAAARMLAELTQALQDPSPAVRVAVVGALGAIGHPAVPALVTAAADPEDRVRAQVAKTLEDIGPIAASDVPRVATLIESTDWRVSGAAVHALAVTGAPAVPALTAAVRDHRKELRTSVSTILTSGLGSEHVDKQTLLPIFEAACHDSDPGVRSTAVDALRQIATAVPPSAILPLLTSLLTDPDEQVRLLTLEVLYQLGPAAAPALDAVLARLGKDDMAPGVVAAIGAAAVPRLVAIVAHEKDWNVVSGAEQALETLAAKDAIPALLERAGDPATPAWVRLHAVAAIKKTGVTDADLPKIVALLGDPDDNVWNEARQILLARGAVAVPALRAAQGDPAATRARGVIAEIEHPR